MDKTYSVDTVAELLNVRESIVEKWLEKGSLNGNKINENWLIKDEDLYEFRRNGIEHHYFPDTNLANVEEALSYAFEGDYNKWWQQFEKPEDAFLLLGELWNNENLVSNYVCKAVAEWTRTDDLRNVNTYAKAARALEEWLRKELSL